MYGVCVCAGAPSMQDVKQGSAEFRILITSFVMIGMKTVTELNNRKLHLKVETV